MLLVIREIGVEVAEISRLSTRSNIEVAIPQTFNGDSEKVSEFVIASKLYLRMRMRETTVKEQV